MREEPQPGCYGGQGGPSETSTSLSPLASPLDFEFRPARTISSPPLLELTFVQHRRLQADG